MGRKKVILDTNLIIAAYWNRRSSSARIIEGCIEGLYKMCYTDRTKKESFRILGNIKAGDWYRRKIQGLFETGAVSRKQVRRLRLIKDDPQDNKYLEAALATRAGYIITNDKHLLKFGSFKRTKILRPSDFIRMSAAPSLKARACLRLFAPLERKLRLKGRSLRK